jgi:hypothetical protein
MTFILLNESSRSSKDKYFKLVVIHSSLNIGPAIFFDRNTAKIKYSGINMTFEKYNNNRSARDKHDHPKIIVACSNWHKNRTQRTQRGPFDFS